MFTPGLSVSDSASRLTTPYGSSSALANLSLNELEDEIGSLSGHINAATYRLLVLIAELDRREPWEAFGCKTCAHYLNWKCGIALSAAREKVRTARALTGLPLICEAFGAGRISYSKARALTRVANPQNEQALLDIALAGTATHVERIARQYRQMQATDSPEEVFDRRSFSCYWDEDGSLVFRGRLTAEQGAVLLEAIAHARVRPDDYNDMDGLRTNSADALVSISESYLAGGGSGARTRTADRFQVKVTAPLECLAKSGVDIEVKAEGKSRTKGKAKTETDAEAKAKANTKATAESKTARNDSAPSPRSDLPVLDDGPALSIDTVRRLCCDGTIIPILEDDAGNPLRIGRKTRTVSPALRRAVDRRDGGCRFPGCTQTHHVDAHHIVHWADGGSTDLGNLVSLCRKHHTLVHEGSFRVGLSAEGDVQFRNRYGVLLRATEEGRFRGGVGALVAQNKALGLEITGRTGEPSWDGSPADYDHIMFVLGQYLPSAMRANR